MRVSHSTASRRHHYERLTSWPEGLLVLGDAVATFNPVYAQGMSVAARGQDIHFPTTRGREAGLSDRLLHRYVSRLSRTATGSFRAATALTDVLALQASPASLVRPRVLLSALAGPLRPQLGSPQFTSAERALLTRVSQHR